ncbi:hypothetical protein FH972_024025 [Carpinus fangiana]|uniref:Uncharacterized protein n=1 Tax=Carpinus fangiana TaxID=176857 RepID=A0A5N6KXM8_9ROSI|nr:hypothetical protein FH972_024025 [Carpinus fangiana]
MEDLRLKLASLRPPPGQNDLRLTVSTAPQAPVLSLRQLTQVRNLINASLDVIDVTTWTGDARNAEFICGQLQLLFENVQEAKQTLKGSQEITRAWCEDPLDDEIFEPSCPPNIALHWAVVDAALILYVRILEPADGPENPESLTGLGIRDRLAVAFGAPKVQPHEELGERFDYKGRDVRVKEMSRVESQDPSLLAAMAKLSALEHSVAMSRTALDTVMCKELD